LFSSPHFVQYCLEKGYKKTSLFFLLKSSFLSRRRKARYYSALKTTARWQIMILLIFTTFQQKIHLFKEKFEDDTDDSIIFFKWSNWSPVAFFCFISSHHHITLRKKTHLKLKYLNTKMYLPSFKKIENYVILFTTDCLHTYTFFMNGTLVHHNKK